MNWNKFLGVLSLIVGVLTTLVTYAQKLPLKVAVPIIIAAAFGKALTANLHRATDHRAWTMIGVIGTSASGIVEVVSGFSSKWALVTLIGSQVLIGLGRDLKGFFKSAKKKRTVSAMLLVAVAVSSSAFTKCDEKKVVEVERKFTLATKRTADYCDQALKGIETLLDANKLSPDAAERFTNVVLTINDIDKRLIEEAQKYVVEVDGKRVLKLTEEGRINLVKYADSLREITLQLLNDPDFIRLTGNAKLDLAFIAAEMLPVVASIWSLIHEIKPLPPPPPIASAWVASPLQLVVLPTPSPTPVNVSGQGSVKELLP